MVATTSNMGNNVMVYHVEDVPDFRDMGRTLFDSAWKSSSHNGEKVRLLSFSNLQSCLDSVNRTNGERRAFVLDASGYIDIAAERGRKTSIIIPSALKAIKGLRGGENAHVIICSTNDYLDSVRAWRNGYGIPDIQSYVKESLDLVMQDVVKWALNNSHYAESPAGQTLASTLASPG